MIRHIGVVVSNLERMIKFYKLLGFKEYNKTEVYGKIIDKMINKNNLNINIVKLKSGDSMIELLKYKDVKNSVEKKELFEQGIFHIAITVDDIEETFELLTLNGAKFLSVPLLSEDKKVKVCFCQDVEDNFLEIVEELFENK